MAGPDEPQRPSVGAPDPRFVQANERTLLAWIRTALGIMAFGFVVARLGLWLAQLQPAANTGASLWIGVALVLFGSGTLLGAVRRYTAAHRALVAGEPHVPGTAFGAVAAGVLAAGGLALAAYLVTRA